MSEQTLTAATVRTTIVQKDPLKVTIARDKIKEHSTVVTSVANGSFTVS